jgi:methylated-DNA-[protein]-cysteine S-methyltransferase
METTYYYRSPLGLTEIRADEKELIFVKPLKKGEKDYPAPDTETSPIPEHAIIRETCRQLDEYFAGKRKEFNLPLSPQGTDFQQKVWKQLQQIPYAATISYKQLAHAAGHPKACRAAGSANGKNPLSIIIPCHRVIASDGGLGGYASGVEIKKQLLDLEKSFL